MESRLGEWILTIKIRIYPPTHSSISSHGAGVAAKFSLFYSFSQKHKLLLWIFTLWGLLRGHFFYTNAARGDPQWNKNMIHQRVVGYGIKALTRITKYVEFKGSQTVVCLSAPLIGSRFLQCPTVWKETLKSAEIWNCFKTYFFDILQWCQFLLLGKRLDISIVK